MRRMCLAVVTMLLAAVAADGQLGAAMPGVAQIAVLAATGAAPGGVRICPTASTVPVSVELNSSDLLVSKFADGSRVAVQLEGSEGRELAAAAKHADGNGCIEVSIDPIADQTEDFASPELSDSPGIASALLTLDADIGTIMAGGLRPGMTGRVSVPTPDEEAERLLKSGAVSEAYQSLARRMSRPPLSWHFTTISVDAARPGNSGLRVNVRPKVFVPSPDDRRLALTDADERVALVPYAPLVAFVKDHVDTVAANLASLERGARYSRAYASLFACKKNAKCQSKLLASSRTSSYRASSSALAEAASQIRQTHQADFRQTGLMAI